MVEGLFVGGRLHVLLVLQQLLLVLELDHLSHLRLFGEGTLVKWESMKIMRTAGNILKKLLWKMRHKLEGHDFIPSVRAAKNQKSPTFFIVKTGENVEVQLFNWTPQPGYLIPPVSAGVPCALPCAGTTSRPGGSGDAMRHAHPKTHLSRAERQLGRSANKSKWKFKMVFFHEGGGSRVPHTNFEKWFF